MKKLRVALAALALLAGVTVLAPADPASAATTASSCVNAGNKHGYCWYQGWRWPSRWICIDTSIPNSPLGVVANMYRSIDPALKVSAYIGAGQCKAHGFPSNRRLTFYPFTAHDKRANPYTCGMTLPRNYGPYYGTNETLPMIKINVTGYKRTPCGSGLEWTDVWAHELGHAYGLSHQQPRATSIMRDGHTLDAYDKYYIRIIMGFYSTASVD